MSSVGTIAIVVELIDSDLIRRLEGRTIGSDGGRMKLKGFAVLRINSPEQNPTFMRDFISYFSLLQILNF